MIATMLFLAVSLVLAFFLVRSLAAQSRAVSLVGEWEAYATGLESQLAELSDAFNDAQTTAYRIASRRKGKRGELPLVLGKSKTVIDMVGDDPVIRVSSFKNRKGEIVEIPAPEKPAESPAESKGEAAPASQPAETPAENGVAESVIDAVVKLVGTLSERETGLIAKWESGKGKSDASEYAKRIESDRKSGKGK